MRKAQLTFPIDLSNYKVVRAGQFLDHEQDEGVAHR